MTMPPAKVQAGRFTLTEPEAAVSARIWAALFLLIAAATLLSLVQALPLRELVPHLPASLRTGAKIAAAGVALAVSLLTWNTRRGQPLNFVLSGFGFFAVAVLNAAQLVLPQGQVGPASGHDAQIALLLQLGADAAAVAALLAAALAPPRPGSIRALRLGIALTAAGVAAIVSLSFAAPRWPFWSAQAAAGLELALALASLLVVALLLLRSPDGKPAFVLLMLATAAQGLGCTLPMDEVPSGLLGDGFKLLAALLVYLALFREGVMAPRHRLVASGRAVEEDRRRYQQLFESAPDGLLVVNARGIIVQANPAAAAMFAWPLAALVGLRVEALLPQQMRAGHERARARYQRMPQAREMGLGGALTAMRRDGQPFPIEIALVPQIWGEERSTMCIVRDVTQRRQLEKSLMRQALHDSLTELPNRRHFYQSIAKAIAHAERQDDTLALLFIDLDNFKQVNDMLGHGQGDELLQQVAQRLGESLRSGDLLARMGGDEFALLLTGARAGDAAAVAGKLLRALEPDFRLAGQATQVGASIGIAMFPADGRSREELLSHADIAMYRAKQRGRNTWCFFEPGMTEDMSARLSLQRDLAQAIERRQFELVYQPRVRVGDGLPSGFEALLRWHHPLRGQVPPDIFIPLAEESGLIVAIGDWVLHESCAQAARWPQAAAQGLALAVNVSTHQLRHPAFAERVQQVLLDTGWPASQLELEITETALMADPGQAAALLKRISALGVRIAIDDFGTGYSSLAYLKDLPLHRLKVDRSFVQDLHADGNGPVIASSIIALAHALGLQVTAEGVETAAQREFLVQRHCDELQGYLFSRPLPAADCEAWLSRAARRPIPEPGRPSAAPLFSLAHDQDDIDK